MASRRSTRVRHAEDPARIPTFEVAGPRDRIYYRWYAKEFDTVEVDSTYYRLPGEEMVQRWAERTPDGFVMHVKAFGVMTRHPVKVEQLPPDLREGAPAALRLGRTERSVLASRNAAGERRWRRARSRLPIWPGE